MHFADRYLNPNIQLDCIDILLKRVEVVSEKKVVTSRELICIKTTNLIMAIETGQNAAADGINGHEVIARTAEKLLASLKHAAAKNISLTKSLEISEKRVLGLEIASRHEEERVDQLAKRAASAQRRIDELETKFIAALAEADSLRNELEQKTYEDVQKEDKKEGAKTEIFHLTKKLDFAHSRVNHLEEQNDILDEKIKELEVQIAWKEAAAKEEISIVKNDALRHISEIETRYQNVDKRSHTTALENLGVMAKKYHTAQTNIQRLTDDNKRLVDQLSHLEDKLELSEKKKSIARDIVQDNERLDEQVAYLTKQLDGSHVWNVSSTKLGEEKMQLQEDVSFLQRELERLEMRIIDTREMVEAREDRECDRSGDLPTTNVAPKPSLLALSSASPRSKLRASGPRRGSVTPESSGERKSFFGTSSSSDRRSQIKELSQKTYTHRHAPYEGELSLPVDICIPTFSNFSMASAE